MRSPTRTRTRHCRSRRTVPSPSQPRSRSRASLSPWTGAPPHRRTAIGKAIGIVMERFQISDDRAFHLRARLSSYENRKLYDIATELSSTGNLPAHRHG